MLFLTLHQPCVNGLKFDIKSSALCMYLNKKLGLTLKHPLKKNRIPCIVAIRRGGAATSNGGSCFDTPLQSEE